MLPPDDCQCAIGRPLANMLVKIPTIHQLRTPKAGEGTMTWHMLHLPGWQRLPMSPLLYPWLDMSGLTAQIHGRFCYAGCGCVKCFTEVTKE